MAKNLTSRLRKIMNPMSNGQNDDTREEVNQNEEPKVEAALENGHQPDMGTPEDLATPTEPESELEKFKRESLEWRDKYMRLYAEFDNFRKRSMKERADYLAGASADVIKELLPVVDDFDRAVKANESVQDVDVVKEGFVLIHQKLYRKLESKGLKPIDATGKPFDTDFHEAITQIPAPTDDLKGKIVDEVEKGYTLNDKVIRFSKVVIGQ
jgi:molecular chaperone GrpE